jgi:hypothetical protein
MCNLELAPFPIRLGGVPCFHNAEKRHAGSVFRRCQQRSRTKAGNKIPELDVDDKEEIRSK